VVGVIGDPIGHSLSPLLHNAAFAALGLDWVSAAFPTPSGAAAGAVEGMRALGIRGLSVTMPHKTAVARHVDRLSPVADRLDAVNCVARTDHGLVGHNTDGAGFLAALRRGCGFDPAGRRCLVAGAGGAARAVILALAEAGAAEVVVVNRTPDRAVDAAALAGSRGRVGRPEDVGEAELVVDATPVGMAGTDGTDGIGVAGAVPLLDPDLLGTGQVVADLVYRPERTEWLRRAAGRGATAVGGLGMLVHQAADQIELWTGSPAPVEVMWEAARRFLGEEAAEGESSGEA
jgi:shikimate dehydrogenase